MDKENFQKAIEHLRSELNNIRTGRAAPTILENIQIESYGQKTPLAGLASISAPEPQTLTVQPWDKNIIKDIEKGIRDANLDLSPVVQGDLIRIQFPPLTEEKRIELVKIMNQRVEDAKISVKNIREDIMKDVKKQKEKSEISEDDYFRQEKEIQGVVDDYNDQIKKISEDKEKDIMTV
ncbi:MAG: ribosome recycling factor [Patescibacteria group bacterium]|nr:ribosome recycling factor [Patescibacteria group bacterium]